MCFNAVCETQKSAVRCLEFRKLGPLTRSSLLENDLSSRELLPGTYTLKGSFGSEVSTILKVTFPLSAMLSFFGRASYLKAMPPKLAVLGDRRSLEED